MRNIQAIVIFGVLLAIVLIAFCLQVQFGNNNSLGMFIVTAMAAIGTCGVTILNVFPYVPKDKLEAILCKRKGKLCIMIYSKSNHMIYLGSDKYHTAEYVDSYALWWPEGVECTEFNSNHIYVNPGDNLALQPHGTIGYPINPKVFGKHDINKVKIQITTSNGYRIDVQNRLNKNAQTVDKKKSK